ncbi:MAG: ABC transporter substrate-binding protein [Bifidobacteriaceae bacterium]|jgi:osmoprotectant transport system substrate-binding protein|nr:ABC transporter substrate-binding protein [Bifidobacteriaceae bacterium]
MKTTEAFGNQTAKAARPRVKSLALAAALISTQALGLAACGGDEAPGGDAGGDQSAQSQKIIVGSADFPESQLLATIYAQALTGAGFEASTKLSIGSREVYIPALLDGSINLLPEYTGATLSYLEASAGVSSPEDVAAKLAEVLPEGVTMLTPSDAQDSDVLAVAPETAEKYGLKTIEDLAPHAGELALGGPPEWETRHEGLVGLKEVYGLEFKEFTALDAGGPLTIAALANGQVGAADLFSTLPAMADFVALEDNKNLFPAQNIVPIAADAIVTDKLVEVLDAVSAALTTADLIEMNARLDAQESIDDVAADWLAANGLG